MAPLNSYQNIPAPSGGGSELNNDLIFGYTMLSASPNMGIDVGPNGLNMGEVGTPFQVDGPAPPSKAVDVDSFSGDGLRRASDASAQICANKPFTAACAWVPGTWSGTRHIAGAAGANTTDRVFAFLYGSGNNVYANCWNSGGSSIQTTGVGPPESANWHTLILTYDGVDMDFWLDNANPVNTTGNGLSAANCQPEIWTQTAWSSTTGRTRDPVSNFYMWDKIFDAALRAEYHNKVMAGESYPFS